MSKLLVTGGAGFIGRHLAAELVARGHDVTIYDALIEQVHGEGAADLPEGVEFLRGDMRDAERLGRALAGCDAVVHLAAEVGVGQSMYEITRYVGANDLGTAVLLEAMIAAPPRRLVVASSMSVYGEGAYRRGDGSRAGAIRRRAADVKAGRWDLSDDAGAPLAPIPTDEEKPVDLASIYALTKYAQERQALIFGEAYGVEVVALRLFNVFGAGQALSNPYTGVLANFASRIASGAAPTIFEDGRQKRDFVHVEDVARAFRLACETPGIGGEIFNIGSGQAYEIAEVARLLAREMGRADLRPEILGRARSGDIRNCFADISKARERLGFRPEHRLETSLGPFVDWVRGETVVDRGAEMRRHLEERRLVS
ncbi:NAD-dependent epimerase/dehydratase family protein [Amaricoccus solimangrovi]|uniref:NAD-dependent epimerase/dehydratase family protein n=1 Tax=Amaricoccus solimangrovi TaxID=2589815 RepID=A0A501WQL7_9RHOB|nr:NAD-dependent epimerase/dehydratase family protein [Amaricoccus solimangrovi]TPE51648.1 NAD-dependent epimerase/dehydratase family protein [Amaricoccus solimangrovi]